MKLRNRLIFRTVALTALIFGLFGSILIQSAFHLQFSRERSSLEDRSARLALSIEAAAVNYALQSISLTDDLLSDILVQLDDTAALYDESGALLAGSESFFPPDDGIYLFNHRLYALRPVLLAGKTRQLLTAADLSPLYQTRRSLLLAYALLYLIMMIVFSAVMFLTAKALTRPIEQLAGVSRRLSGGELTVRAQPADTFEANMLAKSFNHMADTLTGQIERQQRFIADLTHEMKTPLTAMIGHADLIRSGRVTGDDIQLAAHSILKEGRRLNALSARLIDLILLEQDHTELTPMLIRPLIEETIEAMRPAAAEREIELNGSCTDAVIPCDQALFASLLSNLVDNALKSGAKHVTVEGLLVSEIFTLRVIDDGRGMDKEALQRITEPFYRVDKSRSRAQGGAGLGLALCAQIARLHHAILAFESAPGEGTCATLSILIKEAEAHEKA